MFIEKANKYNLKCILDLQYLAYQSEAKLLNNPDIPPLKQTLDDLIKEFYKGVFLKAVDDDKKIIGSVRGHIKNETLYIGKLIVHPDFQRRGIGTSLLLEFEKLYPNLHYELFTSSKSINNIRLYEKLGYKKYKEDIISSGLKLIYLRK